MKWFAIALVLTLAPSVPGATIYTASLDGLQEVPPNGSTAGGSAVLTVNGTFLTVEVTFTGLTSPATAAHIHCCSIAGVNSGVAVGLPAFPASTSGVYSNIFDLLDAAIYSGAFLTASGGTAAGARAALLAAFENDTSYVNIHNAIFPGGEIRGQIDAVPEPASLTLLLVGLGGIAIRAYRR